MDGVYRLLYGRRPRLPLHERLVKYQRLPSSRTRRYHRERKCAENYKKNDIIFFILNCNQHLLVISNLSSFRVLLDKIASVYYISKIR